MNGGNLSLNKKENLEKSEVGCDTWRSPGLLSCSTTLYYPFSSFVKENTTCVSSIREIARKLKRPSRKDIGES